MIVPDNARPGVVLDAAAQDQWRPELPHTALPSTHLMPLTCAALALCRPFSALRPYVPVVRQRHAAVHVSHHSHEMIGLSLSLVCIEVCQCTLSSLAACRQQSYDVSVATGSMHMLSHACWCLTWCAHPVHVDHLLTVPTSVSPNFCSLELMAEYYACQAHWAGSVVSVGVCVYAFSSLGLSWFQYSGGVQAVTTAPHDMSNACWHLV